MVWNRGGGAWIQAGEKCFVLVLFFFLLRRFPLGCVRFNGKSGGSCYPSIFQVDNSKCIAEVERVRVEGQRHS